VFPPVMLALMEYMTLPCCRVQDEVDTPPQPAILSICVRILDQGRNERIPLFQLEIVAIPFCMKVVDKWWLFGYITK
jgi:hypothetical protein